MLFRALRRPRCLLLRLPALALLLLAVLANPVLASLAICTNWAAAGSTCMPFPSTAMRHPGTNMPMARPARVTCCMR